MIIHRNNVYPLDINTIQNSKLLLCKKILSEELIIFKTKDLIDNSITIKNETLTLHLNGEFYSIIGYGNLLIDFINKGDLIEATYPKQASVFSSDSKSSSGISFSDITEIMTVESVSKFENNEVIHTTNDRCFFIDNISKIWINDVFSDNFYLIYKK